jgi:hypothetical protein
VTSAFYLFGKSVDLHGFKTAQSGSWSSSGDVDRSMTAQFPLVESGRDTAYFSLTCAVVSFSEARNEQQLRAA